MERSKKLLQISAGVLSVFLIVLIASICTWGFFVYNYVSAGMRGNYPLAIEFAQKSIDLASRFGEFRNPFLRYSVERLGMIYEARRRYPDALVCYKRQLALAIASDGPDSLPAASALVNVGRAYKKQRQFAEAEPFLRQALKIYESKTGPNSKEVADTLDFLAWAVVNQQRYDEAQTLYERELTVTEHLWGKDNILDATPLVGIGWTLNKKGQFEAGLPYLDRAFKLAQQPYKEANGWLAVALTLLANTYRDHDQLDKAKTTYQIAVTMCDRTLFPTNNLFKSDVLTNYAKLLRRLGEDEKANILEANAKTIRAGGVPSDKYN